MPEMDGVAFLRIAREVQPDSVRMMLSASAEFKTILVRLTKLKLSALFPNRGQLKSYAKCSRKLVSVMIRFWQRNNWRMKRGKLHR
jgi:hypothetical protein